MATAKNERWLEPIVLLDVANSTRLVEHDERAINIDPNPAWAWMRAEFLCGPAGRSAGVIGARRTALPA